jgi:hypothetical protein
MKKRTITRYAADLSADKTKSSAQWNQERDVIQEKIDRKRMLIEKNIELKNLIQKEYSSLEDGTVRKVELEIKFLQLEEIIQSLKNFLKNYLHTFDADFMVRYNKSIEKK